MMEVRTSRQPKDVHVLPEDLAVKTQDDNETFRKLHIFVNWSNLCRVTINWNKIKIIIKENDFKITASREILPLNIEKYNLAPMDPYWARK